MCIQSRDTDIIGALVDRQSLQTDLAMLFGVIAPQPREAVATWPYRLVSLQVRSAIGAVRFAVEDVCSFRLERQVQPCARRN